MSETLFDLSNRYIDRLNAKILPRIDYIRLQESYDTDERAYAKGILNLLHKAAAQIYRKDRFTSDDLKVGPIVLPGILESHQPDSLCLALITLGECRFGRWETDLFTKYGLVLGSQNQPEEIQRFIQERYQMNSYALTFPATFCNVWPHYSYPVRDMVTTFRSYEAELLPHGQLGLVEPEEEHDEEIR